jgi:peptide/nickel transport system permease protein
MLFVSLVVYFIFDWLPSDPARLGCIKDCPDATVELNRIKLGLDVPVLEQWWRFIVGLFQGRTYGSGDSAFSCPAPAFGYSWNRHACVTDVLKETFPVTLSLAFGALFMWLALGVSLGILAARKKGKWQDRVATGFSVIGVSFPTFFLGLISIMVFVIWTGLLPFPQYSGITENPWKWMTSLILPWFVLAIVSAASYVRMTRNGILEVMNEEFVRLGLAKGLKRKTLIVKYVMRAALVPIVTIAGLDFAFLLGGALVTESIFNLPGLGKLTLAAVINSDLPILVATTLVAAVFIVVANAVVDILYGYLDPRVRAK